MTLLHRLLVLIMILAMLVGCASSEKTKTATTGASGKGFPVTLTDAQGVSITIPQKPKRILSIAPTVTEILFAIGAGKQVVGVTDQCDYPPEVKQLPTIGQWWQPSVEKALALQPDLVVGQRGTPPEFVSMLRQSGDHTFTINPTSLADIYASMSNLGRLTGNEGGAQQVVTAMQERMRLVHARIADIPESQRPTAFIIVQVSPVWTAGKGTFQDEAIRTAGAINVGSSVQDFREFSMERLVAADPDFLLVTTMQGDPGKMAEEVRNTPALQQLTAVKHNKILLLEADEIDRPGPRLVNAIETMARAFYPERFATSQGGT